MINCNSLQVRGEISETREKGQETILEQVVKLFLSPKLSSCFSKFFVLTLFYTFYLIILFDAEGQPFEEAEIYSEHDWERGGRERGEEQWEEGRGHGILDFSHTSEGRFREEGGSSANDDVYMDVEDGRGDEEEEEEGFQFIYAQGELCYYKHKMVTELDGMF